MSDGTTDERSKELNLLEAIEYLDGKGIEAGVFGGTNRQQSKKNPKAKRPKKGTPIALYAAVQHEGNRSGTIQPRRFISKSVDKHLNEYDRLFERGAGDVIEGRRKMKDVLESIGRLNIRPDIQEMITDLHVIDTGALRMAIEFKIVQRGKAGG